jgi:hypothetical protein
LLRLIRKHPLLSCILIALILRFLSVVYSRGVAAKTTTSKRCKLPVRESEPVCLVRMVTLNGMP